MDSATATTRWRPRRANVRGDSERARLADDSDRRGVASDRNGQTDCRLITDETLTYISADTDSAKVVAEPILAADPRRAASSD